MKINTSAIALAMLALSLACLAAEPAAVTSTAAAVIPPPSAPAAAPTVDSAAIAKAAHSLGYKSRQHDGKTVYCKSETKVGTSFQTTTCLTEDQVMATVKRAEGNKDSVEALQRAFLVGAPSKEPYTPAGSMRGQ